MDLINQRFALRDGRTLGFAEYGVPNGRPLIYLHGWPGSRLEPHAMRRACARMGLRMIAPDRPGLGLSDFKPGRTLTDFASDVSELADYLGWNRFSVLGVSGGGPYAVACAARLPQRVTVALLVCSVGPADAPDAMKNMVATHRWLLAMARKFPGVAECIGGMCLRIIWRKGHQVIPRQVEVRLPPLDQKALENAELRQALTDSSTEALRRGVRGAATDGLLYAKPWGFALREIGLPVFLWHGEADIIVPAAMGHYLAENIPNCQAQFFSDDGHFSLPYNRLDEILKRVM